MDHHRGRQHHGQGEHHVQRALDSARQLGNIVGGKNAKEEHRRAADEGDAQAVPKGIPVPLSSMTNLLSSTGMNEKLHRYSVIGVGLRSILFKSVFFRQ